MSNPNGEKGYRWEKSCVDHLKLCGLDTHRQKVRGGGDLAPLHSLWSLECKDDSRKSDRVTAEQAERQAITDGVPFGVVLKKTRGRATDQGTVHMTMETWTNLVRYLEVKRIERDAWRVLGES